jgi:hypothetical protein
MIYVRLMRRWMGAIVEIDGLAPLAQQLGTAVR